MVRLALNVGISVAVIAASTWLAKRQPASAGFIAALPITTMLVLTLSHLDGQGGSDRATLARSLLLGIPLSSTFLVPFALAPRWNLGFWACFTLGLVLLGAGFAVHRAVLGS